MAHSWRSSHSSGVFSGCKSKSEFAESKICGWHDRRLRGSRGRYTRPSRAATAKSTVLLTYPYCRVLSRRIYDCVSLLSPEDDLTTSQRVIPQQVRLAHGNINPALHTPFHPLEPEVYTTCLPWNLLHLRLSHMCEYFCYPLATYVDQLSTTGRQRFGALRVYLSVTYQQSPRMSEVGRQCIVLTIPLY